jgi:hypothetical protein
MKAKLENLQHRCRLLEAGDKVKHAESIQQQSQTKKADGIFGSMKSYFSK